MLVTIEECAEVQQALAKVMRFGQSDTHPETPDETNEEQLLTEFYQLTAMMEELQNKKIIKELTPQQIQSIKDNKLEKVYRYLTYSQEKGLVDSDS